MSTTPSPLPLHQKGEPPAGGPLWGDGKGAGEKHWKAGEKLEQGQEYGEFGGSRKEKSCREGGEKAERGQE